MVRAKASESKNGLLQKRRRAAEFNHDSIRLIPIKQINPSPENDKLYKPISTTDPDTIALANSIREHGVKEPLVITTDNYILSGHRRFVAAAMAGLTEVPVRVEDVSRDDPGFVSMLREYNRQRVKTLSEITREEIISADPEEAYRLLVEHRREKSHVDAPDAIDIIGTKHRAEISKAKEPFLQAIIGILKELRGYWPLSVRQIHYQLLNFPPLIHASKSHSRYRNDQKSYKAAVDLIARARLAGHISWYAIEDETRPIETWNVHSSIASFMKTELDGFLKGYYRDLQQSQPNHVEIVGEKNTIASIIRPVAAEYCIPMTIGRGYSSLPPRWKMAQRYNRSGKEKLVLLVLSDHDPEGEDIAHSFARSMRDDFGVRNIVPVKVALTGEQAEAMELPPMMKAKVGSTRHDKFVNEHGDDVFELEAVKPDELQTILRDAIDQVIDTDLFNAEVDVEKKHATHLAAVRQAIQAQLQSFDFWE